MARSATRRRTAFWLAGLVLALAQIATPAAFAQSQLPAAIAVVVDYTRILKDSKAAKSIRDQIDARRKVFQDQISKEEKRLYDAEKDLTKQRSVLSQDAFAEKRKAFEADVANVQRGAQDRRRQLDQVGAAAFVQVRNSLVDVVTALQSQRGFNLVLPSTAVLLFSPQIDLTDDVMTQLDKKLPSVKVPDKAPDQPTADAPPK